VKVNDARMAAQQLERMQVKARVADAVDNAVVGAQRLANAWLGRSEQTDAIARGGVYAAGGPAVMTSHVDAP